MKSNLQYVKILIVHNLSLWQICPIRLLMSICADVLEVLARGEWGGLYRWALIVQHVPQVVKPGNVIQRPLMLLYSVQQCLGSWCVIESVFLSFKPGLSGAKQKPRFIG